MSQAASVTLGFGMILLTACAPTLAGQLRSGPAEPVFGPDARVNITALSPSPALSPPRVLILPVDSSGRFATKDDLAPGIYLVEALVPGYGAKSERVDLTTTRRIELKLKALGDSTPGALHVGRGLDAGRGAGGATLMPPSL